MNAVFLSLAGKSDQYPEVEADVLLDFMDDHQNSEPIPRAQIELAFLAATRNDKVGHMKGALSRGEFFEVLLRTAQSICPQEQEMP